VRAPIFAFLGISGTAVALCAAGIALFLIGVLAGKNKIAEAHGLDKIVALTNVCFAIPLAVFGALHLFGTQFVIGLVPRYMPWRSFWVYFVGCALIAASLSIATKAAVRWSGLLFGIMMFLFVAMIHLRGALARPHDRIIWTIVFREMSFGGAGWILAGTAIDGWRGRGRTALIVVGRLLIAIALILFGIEHFLHPTGLPGVPLQKQMPTWIPGRELIDYVTGVALIVAGGSILLARKTRTAAAYLGAWILLLVLVIYGPVLIVALSEPGIAVQIEGINYFTDTLLFAGTILTVASATPWSRPAELTQRQRRRRTGGDGARALLDQSRSLLPDGLSFRMVMPPLPVLVLLLVLQALVVAVFQLPLTQPRPISLTLVIVPDVIVLVRAVVDAVFGAIGAVAILGRRGRRRTERDGESTD
jgi:uncharacterized membrane protein YphA (DoxX/SURF4 family)